MKEQWFYQNLQYLIANELMSQLGIKTLLSRIPLFDDLFF